MNWITFICYKGHTMFINVNEFYHVWFPFSLVMLSQETVPPAQNIHKIANLRHILYFKLQEQIDAARNYYRHLMFLFIKENRPPSSRLNATIHRIMKTVRDTAEYVREQVLGQYLGDDTL